MLSRVLTVGAGLAVLLAAAPASSQDRGTMEKITLPPLPDPGNPRTPAKQVFGRETTPSATASHVYGFYAKGCLSGGSALPMDGPDWQVMRPSRNRFWGHPALIAFVERFAHRVRATTGSPGVLIGDMAQPRGGPMLGGHASHQIGLDVDVWYRPMPDHRMSREEREFSNSTMVVRNDRKDVDPRLFTRDMMGTVKAAAVDPEVQRIFVNAAIKKAMCRSATGDRSWLEKVRPMYHHDYHFHIRLACPPGETGCQSQAGVGGGEGCDVGSFRYWFSDPVLHPRPPKRPPPPAQPITMAAMPSVCRAIADAPGQQVGER